MAEVNLNSQLALLIKHHGISVCIEGDSITTDLPGNIGFKAWAMYYETEAGINSRLDIRVLLATGQIILESFGDIGETPELAFRNNFQSFSAGSLHPLLAALGCKNPHVLQQVDVENWVINGNHWEVFIGHLTPKIISRKEKRVIPPAEFFQSFESSIKSQQLTNKLHWFRSYYCQMEDEITGRELLMDNILLDETDKVFDSIPILPDTIFYSCRNFIILKKV